MTAQEIRDAVDAGKTVYYNNPAYIVVKDKIGQYFIKCNLNDNYIGLTWTDEVTLNGKPDEFYIAN